MNQTTKKDRPARAAALPLLTLVLLLGACSSAAFLEPPADAAPAPTPPPPAALSELEVAAPNEPELIFSGVQGASSDAQTITLRNVGDAPLELTGLNVSGTDAGAFALAAPPLPLSVEPGGAVDAAVVFTPAVAGTQNAVVQVVGNDGQTLSIDLYGLGSVGEQGENEPPLAAVAQTLGYNVDVGGTGLSLGDGAEAVGAEVLAPFFERAAPGPVTLTVVARYAPEEPFPYGIFTLDAGQPVLQEVGVVGASEAQTLLPARASGEAAFSPGAAPFGVYGQAGGGTQYSLDGLNTGAITHALRAYPLRDRAGTPIPNSYLIGLEEASNGDYQDALFVLSNVRPAEVSPQ